VVGEGINGQRVIKLFDGYQYERDRFAFVNARLRRFAMRLASADAAMTPLTQTFVSVAVAAVIAVALNQAQSGTLTVGSFVAFMTALARIYDPVKRLTNIFGKMQKMLVSAESVFALIDQAPETDAGTQTLHAPIRGEVKFSGVTHRFAGSDRDTLHDVSFTIEPGQTVALVGRSGSGKTSLVRLVPRFYQPGSGRITLDGVALDDYRLPDLRRQIALVGQQVMLFDDSIAANIAYASEADPRAVQAAAEAANAWEFIQRLPDGLETSIGENGSRLSGGQRQRLAIARAIYRDAPILILDEATAALDTESERLVQDALDHLMPERTTLVIAHRLSTIEHADQVLVLDHGRLVEQGTHAELLAHGGLYARLHSMQFREGDAA